MNEPKRSSFEVIQTIAALLGAFASILAGVAQFNNELNHVVTSMVELTPATWWIMLSLLFFVSLGVLWHIFIPRSRLLRPDALLLKTDKQEHLKGRIEDIERLSKLCLDFQQVNLVGESGTGKSALILAGLCPALKEKSSLLPLYMDIWGEDWEAGPEYTLTDILRKTLLIENIGDLWEKDSLDNQGLYTLLGNLRAETGRTPLIIFDQFDDYQARHRSRFIPVNRGTWLSITELVQLNSFWAGINGLLSSRQIHCLFSTRNDAAEGLESIRFVTPQVYRLDRLKPNFIEPILTSLSTESGDQQKIIYAPNSGWERLKSRLARDLSQDGSVLPAQLKMALQGLGAIKSLTVTDYDRAGGLDGIGAAYVEWHIANTARHCQLSKDDILILLTSLVDNEQIKTTQKSQQTIFESIQSTTNQTTVLSNERFVEVLESLSNRGLIRKRLDPDTGGYMWMLYHDYLCRGILEAERRANRWAIATQEAYRTFQEAGNNIVRRWQSLLSPWQQFMMLCACINGRFHYGTLRNFAFLSILRFLPIVAVVTLAGFTWSQVTQWQVDRANLEEASGHFSEVLSKLEGLLPSTINRGNLNALVTLVEKIKPAISYKIGSEQPIKFYKKAAGLGSEKAAFALIDIYVSRGDQKLRDYWVNRAESISASKSIETNFSMNVIRTSTVDTELNFGNYYALIIGNNKYHKIPNLETSVNDATEIEKILRLKYGFKTKLLINSTRHQMLSELNRLRSQLTEEDNLLIYYAGHSELDRVNMRGHWLPVDADGENTANWISTIAISDILNAMSVKHVIVVSDSAYSGSGSRRAIPLGPDSTNKLRNAWLKMMLKARSRTVLISGGSKPVMDGGGDHSVFSNAFIQVLKNNAGILTGQQLYRQVASIVTNKSIPNGFDLVPEYSPIRHAGHEAGEFFFIPLASREFGSISRK